ncbi:MAG: TlpA family protein disulfide reductase [Jatrophihabitantaceae bacterium]
MKLPRSLAGVALAALVLAGCAGRDAVHQGAGDTYSFVTGTALGQTYPVADRRKAGSFTGTLLSGRTLTLEQSAGRVVVINFWATWCGPCTTETPQFDLVYRGYKAKGVDFIGIDTKDIRSKAEAFVRDNNISYPIVFDEKSETALRLGRIPALAFPFTVIVDKHARVAVVYLNKLAAKDLQRLLDKLLAES